MLFSSQANKKAITISFIKHCSLWKCDWSTKSEHSHRGFPEQGKSTFKQDNLQEYTKLYSEDGSKDDTELKLDHKYDHANLRSVWWRRDAGS